MNVDLLPLARRYFPDQPVIRPVKGGLVNRTYEVSISGTPIAVLQSMNPVFDPLINIDIEAVTEHLSARGVHTPRLLRTLDGEAWIVDETGSVWRAISYVPGRTLERIRTTNAASSAGALVGRFHTALDGFAYSFRARAPSVHDWPRHICALDRAIVEHRSHSNYDKAARLAERVLTRAQQLSDMLIPSQPRIGHGDLNVGNVLFSESGDEALALVDLDTLGWLPLHVELGDAFRSWCNPEGEDVAHASFRVDLFEAAIRGYWSAARGVVATEEVATVPHGVEIIAIELAARFCADALEESYFGWNPTKFPSRSEHNLVRTRSQLSLAEAIAHNSAVLADIVTSVIA